MNRRLIIKALKEIGYRAVRDGDHTIYEKEGCQSVQVPMHKEINNNTARKILQIAGIEHRLKK